MTKKFFFLLIMTLFGLPSVGFAEDGVADTSYYIISETDKSAAATAAYVKGAFDMATRLQTSNTIVTTDDEGKTKAYSISTEEAGNFVKSISVDEGQVKIETANVTIPIGSATETESYAAIWLE